MRVCKRRIRVVELVALTTLTGPSPPSITGAWRLKYVAGMCHPYSEAPSSNRITTPRLYPRIKVPPFGAASESIK